MVNVGFAVCTAFHFAEYLVPPRPVRTYRAVIRDERGGATWFAYEDAVLDDSDFARIGADFPAGHLRRGPLGRRGALLLPHRGGGRARGRLDGRETALTDGWEGW